MNDNIIFKADINDGFTNIDSKPGGFVELIKINDIWYIRKPDDRLERARRHDISRWLKNGKVVSHNCSINYLLELST